MLEKWMKTKQNFIKTITRYLSTLNLTEGIAPIKAQWCVKNNLDNPKQSGQMIFCFYVVVKSSFYDSTIDEVTETNSEAI